MLKYCLIAVLALFTSAHIMAQRTLVTDKIKMDGRTLDGISNDTLLAGQDSAKLVTEYAAGKSYSRLNDSINALRASLLSPEVDTTSSLIFLSAHGYDTSQYVGGIIAVKTGYQLASSVSADSTQFTYIVDTPYPDSVEVKASGQVSRPGHGLPVGAVYYLTDVAGVYDTIPGAVRSAVFFVVDANTLELLSQGTQSQFVIPRVVIASPFITSFGGDPRSPSDNVIQAFAEFRAENGLLKPGTLLVTQFNGSTANPTHRAGSMEPSTPAHAWFWDGVQVTRISYAMTSFNLQDTVYGTLQNLPLIPVVGNPPTDQQVADWVETNAEAGVSIPNGSTLYFIGDGTVSSPDYEWIVADDATENGELVKRTKTPPIIATNIARYVSMRPDGSQQGLIGDIFAPFDDFRYNEILLPDSLFYDVYPGTYQYGSGFNYRRFATIRAQPGVTLRYSDANPLFYFFSDGTFEISGKPNVETDTEDRSSYFMQSAGPMRKVSLDLGYVNAVRPQITAYGRDFLQQQLRADLIDIRVAKADFFGSSFIHTAAGSSVNVRIDEFNFIDGINTDREDEYAFAHVGFTYPATDANVLCHIGKFNSFGTDEQKRGPFQIAATSSNSRYDLRIGQHYSNAIRPQSYIDGASSRPLYGCDIQLGINNNVHYNSVINIHVGSATGSLVTWAGAVVFDSTRVNINIDNYRGRHRLLNLRLTPVFRNKSVMQLSCGDCVIQDDRAVQIDATTSIDSTSLVRIVGRYRVLMPGETVIRSAESFYLDAYLENDGITDLVINNGSDTITVYVLGGNLTSDRVAGNIRIVDLREPPRNQWQIESFTATAGQTDFTVSTGSLPIRSAEIRVYDDAGAKLRETTDYTIDSANGTVTLVVPASAGEVYEIEYYQ